MSPEDLARWVAASCEAQGVEVKITDLSVLRPLAALLSTKDNE